MTLQNQRLLVTVLLIPVCFVILFVIYSYLTRFQPDAVEVLQESDTPDSLQTNTAYPLIVWDVNHAAAGFDSTRSDAQGHNVTRQNVLENLRNISNLIVRESLSFSLLQEIDFYSARSFYVNQVHKLVETTSHFGFYAPYQQVSFHPLPLLRPTGRINSGLLTLSRFTPAESKRVKIDEPSGFDRLFASHNCLLVNRFPVGNGKSLILINTHLRVDNPKKELSVLKSYIEDYFLRGTYIILGGYLVSDHPGNQTDSQQNVFESIPTLLAGLVPNGWVVLTGEWNENVNQLPHKGKEKKDEKRILFVIASPNVKVTESLYSITNNKPLVHGPIRINFELK